MNKNDNRIETVQKYLLSGMTRQEIAIKLGYNGWRSLDIFMRRSGMRWDGVLNKYLSEDDIMSEREVDNPVSSSKVSKIISLFKSVEADPKQIARQTGFDDHRQMASYMSARGYLWSSETNNYVKASTKPKEEQPDPESEINPILSGDSNSNPFTGMLNDQYAHLFNFLIKHKDRLLELLEPENYGRTIPRYYVPGITRTKSFYMSDSLSRLLNEFCSNKNLSQKEVIEAALIEFLSKYSFRNEVDALIKGK